MPDGYMNLDLPVVGSTSPDWGAKLNAALTAIENHDHNATGAQVPIAAVLVNQDVELNNNDITEVRSVRLQAQDGYLVGGLDVGCAYRIGQDLYFNNGSGTPIRITQSGVVNASSSGNSNVWATTSITSHHTILSSDTYVSLLVNTTSARNITLPAANAVSAGRVYIIRDISYASDPTAGATITLIRNGSDTFDGYSGNVQLQVKGGTLMIQSNGSNKWHVSLVLPNTDYAGQLALTLPSFKVDGALYKTTRAVSATTTLLATDQVILGRTQIAVGDIDLTLPPPIVGRVITIADSDGYAGSTNINVLTHTTGIKISGANSYRIQTNYQSITVMGNGSHWLITHNTA